MTLTRRETLYSLAGAGIGLGLPAPSFPHPRGKAMRSSSSLQTLQAAARKPHEIVPLPFDPKKLSGISERMVVSHHENNYSGAVRNLNKLREQLGGLPGDAPGFLVAGLKERELAFRNSAVLHEHYFGNLGGDGRRAGSIDAAIITSWGSAASWEAEFRATALSLAGGSGWVLLALDLPSRQLGTYWSGNHTQGPAAAVPLLVLDMYEHAFHIDYGAAAAKYVDAFFANVNWAVIEQRFERGLRAAGELAK